MEGAIKELRIKEGEKTLNDACEKLHKYHRCLVFRPTGFGKSHMLAYLSQRYNRSLYVYPLDIIKESMDKNYKSVLHNTDFLSYRGMLEKFKRGELRDYLINNGYDLIMFDEVHQIGAINFREVYVDIEYSISMGASIIGVTATPDRMDEFDYQTILFKNIKVYKYTLHNCISDGLMLKPYYVHSVFDISDEKIKSLKNKTNHIRNNFKISKYLDDKITQAEIQIANLLNAPYIIKKHVTKLYGNSINYLKFIVFFPSIQNLHDKEQDVAGWFQEAFPNMSVNTLIVSSESEHRGNIKKLNQLKQTDNVIDLLLCIDMLNMGYHVDDLSGIVMIRGTRSSIVYWQQVGRCMSVKADKPALIFDFVCNYKINPFILKSKESNRNYDDTGVDGIDLDVKDLVIDDTVATYEEFINKLDAICVKQRDKEITFLYEDRKMPVYILAKRFNVRGSAIIKTLRNNGVYMQDESILKNFGIDGRQLYSKNKLNNKLNRNKKHNKINEGDNE